MIAAGAPDTSFTGVLKETLKKVASKVASDTGEALIEKGSDFISLILDTRIDVITEKAGGLFEPATE